MRNHACDLHFHIARIQSYTGRMIEWVAVRFNANNARNFKLDLEGDLVALLSLGLSANAAMAGAAGAAGLREQVRSVTLVAGARNHRELRLPAVNI